VIPLLLAACARGPVLESIAHETYRVSGRTRDELVASLDRDRPRPYDGWTDWHVAYEWDDVDCDGRCRPTTTRVALDLRVTLPSAAETPGPPVWVAYLERLSAHEAGHVRVARRGARRLSGALARVSGPTEADARGRLRAIGRAWLERIEARQQRYDRRTDHGRRQGAAL
jgi:predicted secreted Zn-dependent protease